MRLRATRSSSINAGVEPKPAASLDLRFADTKSLTDAVTGQSLVTFNRASRGTYFDSAGVLQSAVTNLLLRSEEFENASWVKAPGFLAFGSGSIANAITAPNGTTTADLLTESTAVNAERNFYQSGFTTTPATLSCYIKPNGRNFVGLRFYATSNNWVRVTFTLTGSGSASAILAGSSSDYSATSASIASVGNGWYRVSLTATRTDGIWTPSIDFATSASPGLAGSSNGNEFYTGDGTSGIYFWGAQLEQSSTVGEYIPTTTTINSAPRFDHNPATGESLGLLIEEQRTNLITNSEDFGTNWGLASATRTLDVGTAPNGTLTADRVESTGGGVFRAGVGVANATAYTYSVFLKHVSGTGIVSNVGFERFGATPLAAQSSFNVQTGVIVSNGASVAASSITAFGNGWYRVTVTAISTDTTATVINYASTSGNQFLIWGAQLEAGVFSTSYIPTTTAAATRSADIASITGTNFSSWYRQDEGTVFVNATTNATHGGFNSFPRKLSISDGTNSNSFEDYYRVLAPYTDAGYRAAVANVDQAQFDTNNQRNGQSSVIGYAANNYALVIGGIVINTDLSGTVPTTTQLRLGQRGDGSAPLNGTIRRLTYFPLRLSNHILQRITQ